jgi:pyridoxine 5-phosphate synthase
MKREPLAMVGATGNAFTLHQSLVTRYHLNMTKLSVNVNKVATLRNTRHLGVPSVVRASQICLDAGADGITIHPRPDQRHIRPGDVDDLATLWRRYPQAEFNIEGNPFLADYIDHAQRVHPTQCTLVPDSLDAFTSDHGWDLAKDGERLKPVIQLLHNFGARVSLFMDSTPEAMAMAKEVGADRVELYTEPYASGFAGGRFEDAVAPYTAAAVAATAAGLGINAGHDLNLDNLSPFLEAVKGVDEVSIGHALIADALEFGLAETVRKYLAACR